MTTRPVPWTRAERTREIGYAAAMGEVADLARELRKNAEAPRCPDCTALPPEVAWWVGALEARAFMDKIIEFAGDAWLIHFDPAFFADCVDSVGDGGYGTPPAEPGGAALPDGGVK